jgi:hypothetical protein
VKHGLRDRLHLADVPEDLAGLHLGAGGDAFGRVRYLSVADDAAGVPDLERMEWG